MDTPVAASSWNNQPEKQSPCVAIQSVMALPWLSKLPPPPTTGTATTIEESNVSRPDEWLILIVFSSAFIGAGLYSSIIIDGAGAAWLVPGHMLTSVYMAAAVLAKGHVMLFLPRAPLIAFQALYYAGLGAIGMAVNLSNAVVSLLFYWLLPCPCVMVAWFCIVAALVAALVAFWLCLVRTYSSSSPSSSFVLEMAQRSSGRVADGLAYLYSRLLYEGAIRCNPTDAGLDDDRSRTNDRFV